MGGARGDGAQRRRCSLAQDSCPFAGARASIEAAPAVAELIARELGRDEGWKKKAVEEYEKVAQGYVLQDA